MYAADVRVVVVAALVLLSTVGCAAGEADLRRHAVAFPAATHAHADVRAISEPELRALRRGDHPHAARDDREAAAWVARALAWLEWVRRGRWLERLQTDYCQRPPSRAAHEDVIGDLAEDARRPEGCEAATRTLDAIRIVRDALERSPFPGVLRPLRAAIEQLGGAGLSCTTSLTGPTLAAVRHFVELEPYGSADQCPAIASVGGPVSLEHVRAWVIPEVPPAPSPEPAEEPDYNFEDDLYEIPTVPPPFRDGVRVEVSFEGLHAVSFYSVLVARLDGQWRVITVVASGQGCF